MKGKVNGGQRAGVYGGWQQEQGQEEDETTLFMGSPEGFINVQKITRRAQMRGYNPLKKMGMSLFPEWVVEVGDSPGINSTT